VPSDGCAQDPGAPQVAVCHVRALVRDDGTSLLVVETLRPNLRGEDPRSHEAADEAQALARRHLPDGFSARCRDRLRDVAQLAERSPHAPARERRPQSACEQRAASDDQRRHRPADAAPLGTMNQAQVQVVRMVQAVVFEPERRAPRGAVLTAQSPG
jgi:hypothetical protein